MCKKAFNLGEELDACPNIEVELDVVDKMPFFIKPYHVKEENKKADSEIKRLCYLGILKGDFSAYSSPVMLIGRKLTKYKRCVSDFAL